jgi:hypothetical protein
VSLSSVAHGTASADDPCNDAGQADCFSQSTPPSIANNIAGLGGGGIDAFDSDLTLTNSTVAGNFTRSPFNYGVGGGIHVQDGIYTPGGIEVVLRNSTVTGNQAAQPPVGGGGGVALEDNDKGSVKLILASSIVAGNYAGSFEDGDAVADDIQGAVAISDGHNVLGTDVEGAVSGDALNARPKAIFPQIDPTTGGGRLALSGGPTPTVSLLDSSTNPALSGAEPI